MEEKNKRQKRVQTSYLLFGIAIGIYDIILFLVITSNYIYFFSGKIFFNLDSTQTSIFYFMVPLLLFYTIIAMLAIATYFGLKKESIFARYTGIISIILFTGSFLINMQGTSDTTSKMIAMAIIIPPVLIFIYSLIYWNEIKGYHKITYPNRKTSVIIICSIIALISMFLFVNYANIFDKNEIIGTWEPFGQSVTSDSSSLYSYSSTITFYNNNSYKMTFINNSNGDCVNDWGYYEVSNGKIHWSYDGSNIYMSNYVTFENKDTIMYFHSSKDNIYPLKKLG